MSKPNPHGDDMHVGMYLTRPQGEWLRAAAEAKGVSVRQYIRELLAAAGMPGPVVRYRGVPSLDKRARDFD